VSVRLAAVVPSLGASESAGRALARLRAELAPFAGELVWVHQGERAPPALGGAGEHLLRFARPLGFARAVNAGLDAARDAELVAVVNDDLEPAAGWLPPLVEALRASAGVGAAQGVHLRADDPQRADGCGLAWNRWLQAVQVGHGEPPPAPSATPFEVFGVSATAALYRRSALDGVARADGAVFDERLDSWYEDVDLAVRLRAAGWGALCVPAARALHAGGSTGDERPFLRARRVAGNRWLVVARLLGRRFPAAVPRLLARDLADLAHALGAGRIGGAAAIAAGWLAAALRLPAFLRAGAPLLARPELERFRVGSGA
jgi:GT2 family glycosyltransferase